MPMNFSRLSSLCLAISLACQFSACSGSGGGSAKANVLSGGAACSKITGLVSDHKAVLEKDPQLVINDQNELQKVSKLVVELEKIAQEHTLDEDYDCVIKDVDGSVSDFDRSDLLETIAELKGTYGV